MSENINLRPISELPEVESVSEGDKLLLNSNGEAKMIAASKVGGSGGGGGTVYLQAVEIAEDLSEGTIMCYADEALTQPIDYETGKKLFMAGAGTYGSITAMGMTAFICWSFSFIMWDVLAPKTGTGMYVTPAGAVGTAMLIFSDSPMD